MKKYIPPLPKQLHRRCIQGHDYRCYEIGRGHVLVSKDNKVHIKFAARPNGCLCFYLWQDSKWQPKYKYEDIKYADMISEKKIFDFMQLTPSTL